MWFIHDDVPVYYTVSITDFLNVQFPKCWIVKKNKDTKTFTGVCNKLCFSYVSNPKDDKKKRIEDFCIVDIGHNRLFGVRNSCYQYHTFLNVLYQN